MALDTITLNLIVLTPVVEVFILGLVVARVPVVLLTVLASLHYEVNFIGIILRSLHISYL